MDETPAVVYPSELPSNPKASFEKMHEFLAHELVDDVAYNVRCFVCGCAGECERRMFLLEMGLFYYRRLYCCVL